jgi:hypothetical protein
MDSHLKKLQQALSEATAGMSAEERSWHPPRKWCVDEVLEHLYLTYTGTIRGFTRVLEAGTAPTARATFGQRARILLVVGLGYMPEGRSAPAGVVPRGVAAGMVSEEIGRKIAEMDEIIGRCERELGGGKFRERAIMEHPILGPLTTGQWRKFHLVHGMHHVKQIRRLRGGQGSVVRD